MTGINGMSEGYRDQAGLRICLIGLHFAEYSLRLAIALAERNDVLLVLSDQNYRNELGDDLPVTLPRRLDLMLLPHKRTPSIVLPNVLRLIRVARKFRPDIIHAQENTKDYLILALPFLRKCAPLVVTVHDPTPHFGADADTHRRTRHGLYQKWARTMYDRCIVHGVSLAKELVFVQPRLVGCVNVVPHGPLGPMKLPEIGPDRGALLFFGRINAYKGLRYFIDAVERLKARGLKVKGVIAGTGTDLENHRAAVENNLAFELHDRFVSRSDVDALFTRAQVVVLPYTDASQSGVAAMAFGFGRPVVATRVGALPEMVKDQVTGLLVPPRDSEALADAIAHLICDDAAFRRLSANVKAEIDGDLSWSRIAALTETVYRAAIQGRKLPKGL